MLPTGVCYHGLTHCQTIFVEGGTVLLPGLLTRWGLTILVDITSQTSDKTEIFGRYSTAVPIHAREVGTFKQLHYVQFRHLK